MTDQLPAKRRGLARGAAKILFIVVVAIGAGLIIAFEYRGIDKVFASASCCALMVVYLGLAALLRGLRMRPDQLADNAYYMGLLFTLTSLAVTLFRLSDGDVTLSIIRNFGIALSTTIVGLALRVLLSQFRDDPADLEEEARLSLGQSVRRMRGELDDALVEMKRYSAGVQQILGEVGEKARTSTGEVLSNAVERFEAAVETMAKRLEASTQGISSKTEAFDASVNRVVGAIEGLADRVGLIRADASLVEEHVRPAFTALTTASNELAEEMAKNRAKIDRTFKSLGRLAESGDQLNQTTELLGKAAGNVQSTADALARHEATARAAEAGVGSFVKALTSASGQIDAGAADAAAQMSRLTAEATTQFQRMRNDLQASHASVQHVRQELADMASFIIKRLAPTS